MLYSTTKHTLKNELGAHHFLDEVHGTEKKDFSPEGFQEYKTHVASEAPLTQEELLKKEEVRPDVLLPLAPSTCFCCLCTCC